VTARTTSTARTANRAAIIVFVMRSTPLRKPARVTNTPISTTTSMNATIISGSARSPLNTPSTAPASRPSNVPAPLNAMNASIHPATVV
jgi:hypothetical protein